MDNNAIADNFSLLAKLINIHGDDSFKAKSYSSAAYTIEKLPVQLSSLTLKKIYAVKGIGEATGKKITEQLETGRLAALDEYINKTPAGIFDLLKIKGLGQKKISVIWKELGIESIGELLYAQKGGLTAANNLSSFTLQQFEDFIEKQRKKRQNNL